MPLREEIAVGDGIAESRPAIDSLKGGGDQGSGEI